MSIPKIKFCGITNKEDAILAADLGVDALGFNFYPSSPRYIKPENAARIITQLPKGLLLVGVFVNADKDQVLRIAQEVCLNTLQFHGDENESYVASFSSWRVIKAVRLTNNTHLPDIVSLSAKVDHLLFDKYEQKSFGGTGKEIESDMLQRLGEQGLLAKAFLAGGLSPNNVLKRISQYQPYAVDVASGIESSPGMKDRQKMRLFVEQVRSFTSPKL